MIKLVRSKNNNHVTNDINKRNKIFESIDKLMVILPDYESFFLNYELKFLNLTTEEKKNFPNIGNEIRIELLEIGYIKGSSTPTNIFVLTDLGRVVKSKGGHFKYLKSLEPKKDWFKIIPIILSIVFGISMAIIGVLNYKLNRDKDKSSIEKEQLNKQIDSLREKIKILENKRGLN